MAVLKANVPITVATGVICLLVGGGLGAVIMSYTLGDKARQAEAGTPGEEAKGKGGMKAPGPAMVGGEKGDKGGKGPGPKAQLALLVTKLDLLTGGTLRVDLTPEQKAKAKEILAGFAEKGEPSDEEAKDKLDKLLALFEPNKKALDALAIAPPGGRGGGGGPGGGGLPGPPPNPLMVGPGNAHLVSLKETLNK